MILQNYKMKRVLQLFILFTPLLTQAQKILFDKRDPFNNERSLSTDNLKLMPVLLQTGVSATISADKKRPAKIYRCSDDRRIQKV